MSIEVKNVTYTYMPKTPFERIALKNIDLCIEKKEFTAIAGHTGSGKSTLVQQLNGLLDPTEGEVLVDGIAIHGKNAQAAAARRKVGMVFQYPEHQLFEESIFADIAFGPRNLELAEADIEQRVKKAMEFVNLPFKEYKDRSPFQLSGGQMRRVAIAGVIALQPEYLILDEPTAGLDPRGRRDLLEKISQLHRKEGIGVVLVSHNMDDVAELADRVIFMSQGKITVNAPPMQAFSETEHLKEAGLDLPQMVQLLQVLKTQGLSVKTDIFTIKEAGASVQQALKEGKKCCQI
jgi:energy-coupling factor transport system ATP-binding protein